MLPCNERDEYSNSNTGLVYKLWSGMSIPTTVIMSIAAESDLIFEQS